MDDDDLVFTNEVGRPTPSDSFNAKFAKLVKKAGIEGRVRFHDLRHTHGTMLASLPSINAKDISARLGHSDVKFTLNRYVTPTRDRQHEVAEALMTLRKKA